MKFPTVEELKKANHERPPLTDILLGIAMLGTLPLLFVAPGLIRIVDMFGKEWRFPRKHAREALRRIEKRGYVRIKPSKKNTWDFELTKRGEQILRKQNIEYLQLPKPNRWDGIWRLVVFDIPEKREVDRANFRWKLQDLGFRYLNLSVWACPYPCKNEVNAIAEFYNVGKYVRYIEATHVDGLMDPK